MGLPEACTASDISKLVARCLANYGEKRGVDMRLLVAEWHQALKGFDPARLHTALSEHIRSSPYWPTIAEVVATLQQAAPKPELPGLPAWKPDAPDRFERNGRTVAEEIAHRQAQVAAWKAEYGFGRLIEGGRP